VLVAFSAVVGGTGKRVAVATDVAYSHALALGF